MQSRNISVALLVVLSSHAKCRQTRMCNLTEALHVPSCRWLLGAPALNCNPAPATEGITESDGEPTSRARRDEDSHESIHGFGSASAQGQQVLRLLVQSDPPITQPETLADPPAGEANGPNGPGPIPIPRINRIAQPIQDGQDDQFPCFRKTFAWTPCLKDWKRG